MDHLDFIRIRGLNSAETEVFQGAAGGGSVSGGTVTTQSDWTAIPEEAIEMINTYTDDLNTWLQGVNEEAEARGLKSREVTTLAPYVPNIISTAAAGGAIIATGGAALPAIATMMITQTIGNLVGQAVQNYIASQDENSPANILKKAFLYDDAGTLESILGTALLQLTEEEKSILQQRLTELNDAVKDLRYNDEVIDFGGARLHLRGKVIGT